MKVLFPLLLFSAILLFFINCSAPNSKFTNIGVNEYQNMIKNSDVIQIDVRSKGEVKNGTIDGAINIDVLSDDFVDRIKTLDKSKVYLVHCRSGKRSARACNIMSENGFEKLYNLNRGYLAWTKETK